MASGQVKVLGPLEPRRAGAIWGRTPGGGALLSRGIAANRPQFCPGAIPAPNLGNAIRAMSSQTYAILSAAAAGAEAPPGWVQFLPLVAMVAVFWFLIIRPQMKRQKEHQTKISAIKKGDQVLTGGGLLAKVIKIDDHYAELELGPNIRVKAVKSTLADVVPPAGTTPAND